MGYWIVVVDDDAIELKNAKNQLSSEDLRVSCLRSGKDLLKFMENNTPDLVLLDILMPEMDGFETFHYLRELEEEKNRSATPVIFLSGNNDNAAERRSLKDGASDFIRKPLDKDILLSRINKTIENNRTIENLTKKATLDKLTGFLNKASGTEKISGICKDGIGALMLLDMDNFKLVNDLYGHDMGDQVLVSFAEIVRYNTRAEDTISRIGGDEFLAFFSNLTSKIAVKALTDRLNEQLLNKCFELMGDDFEIPIGISVGVAFVPNYSKEFQILFRAVDSAMYRVKQNGKHGVWICDENMPSPEDEHKNNLDDDLVRLSKVLEERHSSDGAMILGLDTFIQTYRFALRFLKRYEKGAEKVLFSLTFDESEENPSEITAHFMEFLQKQLRKSDVIIQIKSDQILVFLPIITKEEGDMVIERIEKAFQEADFATTHIKHVADHISFE